MFGASIFEFCNAFPTTFPAGAGSGTITCAAPNLPGTDTITGVGIWDEADYDFGNTSLNSVTLTFTPSTTLTTWTSPVVTCTVIGAGNSAPNACSYSGNETAPGTVEQMAAGNFTNLNTAGFTVAISSTLNGGQVAQSSAGVIAEFDYNLPTTGTPEPGSMMLLGSGLLAAGLFGRKFAKK
jgi:hypothetical protein